MRLGPPPATVTRNIPLLLASTLTSALLTGGKWALAAASGAPLVALLERALREAKPPRDRQEPSFDVPRVAPFEGVGHGSKESRGVGERSIHPSPDTFTNVPRQRQDYRRHADLLFDSDHPNIALHQSAVGGLFILAGSIGASSHEQMGVPREDAFAVRTYTADNSVVAAIADGLGSSASAHRASIEAARLAARTPDLRAAANIDTWGLALRETIKAISGELRQMATDERDELRLRGVRRKPDSTPSTTLTLASVSETAKGMSVAWASLGNSDLLVHSMSAGSADYLNRSDIRGGQATRALPRDDVPDDHGVAQLNSDQVLLMITDGTLPLLGEGRRHLLRAIVSARTGSSGLADLQTFLDHDVQGAHDDRSVLIIGCRVKQ